MKNWHQELTSAFLCSELGFTKAITNNASYIRSWINILANDNSSIFKAEKQAEKASELITAFTKIEVLKLLKNKIFSGFHLIVYTFVKLTKNKRMNMEPLKKVIKSFLLHCQYEKRLSNKTNKAYGTDLTQFIAFFLTKKVEKIREVDRRLILEYLQYLHNQEYKTKSIKRKIACIKAMFNYYEYEQGDFINPFRKIRIKLKEQFKLPTVMNLQEISSILQNIYLLKDATAKGSHSYKSLVRDIAVLELLFATGLRVSELVNLKSENINLMMAGQLKVLGKGNKERIIQVCNPDVLKILNEYKVLFQKQISKTGYFFINRLHKRLSDQSARTIVKNYTTISKIAKHITPHTYRHTFATMLLEEGVDIKYIQKLLGHSSIMTTQIYTHVSNTKQREILSEKHPRNRVILTV